MQRNRLNNPNTYSNFPASKAWRPGGGRWSHRGAEKGGGGAAWTLHSIIYIYASHRILLQRFLLAKPAEGFRQTSALQ